MSNYRYWRTRALAESENEMTDAHRELYEGGLALKNGDLHEARKQVLEGLKNYETVLERFPDLSSQDDTIDEVLTGILTLQYTHQAVGEAPPQEFPLKWLWTKEQGRVPELHEDFRRENRL
jgi:hypothetical protein